MENQIAKSRLQYLSADKFHRVYAYIWRDKNRSHYLGVLQISHGMREHMGRYDAFAKHMAAKGYIVCGNDHLGHGRTAYHDLGFFADHAGCRLLSADMARLSRYMKKCYGLPLYLLGHSMGSFASRNFLVRYPGLTDGCILLGTSSGSISTMLGFIVHFIRALLTEAEPRNFFHSFAHNPKKACQTAFYGWLTVDPKIRQAFVADPLCAFPFTWQASRDLVRLLHCVNKGFWYRSVSASSPLLILSGSLDPVGFFGFGPRKVAGKLKGAGALNVTLHILPNTRHEVLNDAGKTQAVYMITQWLQNQRC